MSEELKHTYRNMGIIKVVISRQKRTDSSDGEDDDDITDDEGDTIDGDNDTTGDKLPQGSVPEKCIKGKALDVGVECVLDKIEKSVA
jgi:hypothetical protein